MMTSATATSVVSSEPGDVLDMLRRQGALYATLEGLAERQRVLVSREDVTPLLSLLADRQRLSQELMEVGKRLAPIRKRWVEHRQRLAPAEQQEADQLLRSSSDRLSRIIESDEHDARVLSGRKQSVGEALGKTASTGRALSAYRASAGSERRAERVDEGA